MAGPLLVGAEGVLLVPNRKAYASSRPITEGIELVHQLQGFPTSKLGVIVGTVDTERGAHWCRLSGLPNAAVIGIVPEDQAEEDSMAQWHAIERERSMGPVNLVITAYKMVFMYCQQTHQPVLLFGRRGGLGEVGEQPTWDTLRNSVTRHREAVVEEDETQASRYNSSSI